MAAGSVGDIDRLGDEWALTLFDTKDREIAAFVFQTERDARKAHRMMQDIVARSVAVSAGETKD
jgi:hypothetical protein